MKIGIKILFLYFSLFAFLGAETINVQLVLNFKANPSSQPEFIKKIPLLQKYGLNFVNHNPDVILICGSPTTNTNSLKAPIIILDEEESASTFFQSRNCLADPRVIGLFKNTTLRTKNLYNESTIIGRFHFKLIDSTQAKKLTDIKFHHLNKIRCVLWDTFRSPFKEDLTFFKNESLDLNNNRPVDVFFAGTINEKRPPGTHRNKALLELEKISGLKLITHRGRLPKDEYFSLLKQSKIAVSPWGNGEWCWRDYEAIYSGAIVIKPDTSFVQSVPDLYQNNRYYVPCAHDFSDLHEKITYVLNNYETFTEMRKNARALLMNYWDDEKIAQNLAHAIKQTLKEKACTSQ